MRTITVPDLSLVALVGVTGSGKSTFAREHFAPTQILSSDAFRAMVADDENDQSATHDAFDALHFVAGRRLRAGRLTVVDATHVQRDDRAKLVDLAREYDVLPTAIVFDLPLAMLRERNKGHRNLADHVIRRQHDALRRSIRHLAKDGFRKVHVLSPEDTEVTIEYEKAYNDKRELTGPFDIIGDVHGCHSELVTLLTTLGYEVTREGAHHPEGRTAVFVGDLVDRGPDTPGVLRLVMGMVSAGTAVCVSGNHENKLVRALDGRNVKVSHGLAESLAQLAQEPEEFRKSAREFMYGLVSHYRLDGGKLVVAHAGLKEEYQGRSSGRVRSFCLYGETTGETDEYGLPVRYPWADDYRGRATVVYGHTPVPEATWVNNTICIDTGCVFGGKLTALRWPTKELVSVPAEKTHYEPTKPLTAPTRPNNLLRIDDVLGTRHVEARLMGRLKIREENAAGALEVMSRWAIAPQWLPYLPPTMAPCATSTEEGTLEHPTEAFAAYQEDGITNLVCEEKHMGSRAVVILCRDEEVARTRFNAQDSKAGAVYTRTGRTFFDDPTEFLDRLRTAATKANLWTTLKSDWLILDAELLPWSAKAGQLLRRQYAPVGAAATAALQAATAALEKAASRTTDATALLTKQTSRLNNAKEYVAAYERYCWPVNSIEDISLAPFTLLAAEGHVHATNPREWHERTLNSLIETDPTLLRNTKRTTVDVTDRASLTAATDWWEALTESGGEGMVVKPATTPPDRLVQPGIKCRGREYLRIIYGPDYTEPENLNRLRKRSLGRKRSLALREYALGMESLTRFVENEPLWRVHEPVFAVLALESEPVDPRL
jgi:protein phosphatase